MSEDINELIDLCPQSIDLTNEEHSELILTIVEKLLKSNYTIAGLQEIENEFISRHDESLTFILLAIKIAVSKLIALESKGSIMISVVFAVYKEHNRILKSREHPHGEDFLLKKVNQMDWLFGDLPNIQWELIVVDDGCPENSGKIAQRIVDENGLNNKVRVLYLSDAIEKKYMPVASLTSTSESQKGGSIVYGMWDTIRRNPKGDHIVIYTDADLSTHLGQLMLLVEPLVNQNKPVAIGSRRETKSVVIKKGVRNDRGKLFIYLWKRLIPNLGDIIDTQCGFKAFRSEIIPSIIEKMIEPKFAFDIELLLRAELIKQNSIEKVPIAWIDSEAASTTKDIQPYLPMLKSIAKMNNTYFSVDDGSHDFVSFINELDEEGFNRILENIPPEIVNREPQEFTRYDKVTVDDILGN